MTYHFSIFRIHVYVCKRRRLIETLIYYSLMSNILCYIIWDTEFKNYVRKHEINRIKYVIEIKTSLIRIEKVNEDN